MPRLTIAKSIANVLGKARAQRKEYVAKIAKLQAKVDDIDASLRAGGMDFGAPSAGPKPARKTRGRPRKAGRGGGRRSRGQFTVTGEDSVIAFIKKHGNPTTAEVNKHWKSEGRGGLANNTLTRLTQQKQLKRVKEEGVRGSRYTVAG
jgi:hypothetical protein